MTLAPLRAVRPIKAPMGSTWGHVWRRRRRFSMKAKSTLPVLDVTKCVAIWPGVVAMVGLMVTALAQGQQNTAPTTVIVTSKITIQEAQKDLQVLGYEPGPADGAMSQKTQHALELFQHEYMPDPITKKLDKPTIDRLSSNAAAAIRDNRTGLQARPGSGCPVVVASAEG